MIGKLIRTAIARCLVVALSMTATAAWATVTAIVQSPIAPDTPVLGTQYSLSPNNADGINTISWKVVRKYAAGCQLKEIEVTKDTTVQWGASVPHTADWTMDVTYNDPGMGQPIPPPTTLHKTITIAAADGFRVLGGQRQLVTVNSQLTMRFQVQSAGVDCGPVLGGLAQEKLTGQVYGSPLAAIPDKDWLPSSPSDTFYMTAGVIYDEKSETITQAAWDSVNVGDTFYEGHEDLRILYNNPCGGPDIEMTLQGLDIKKRKQNATQWWID